MKRISLHKVMAKLVSQPKKVDLATMQDLKAVTDAMDTAITRVNQEIKRIIDARVELDNRIDKAGDFRKKATKMEIDARNIIVGLRRQAQELGIDADDLKEVKDFMSQKKQFDSAMEELLNIMVKYEN